MTDALAELKEVWKEDLALVVNEHIAEVFARHFIADLSNRYQVRPRARPRTRSE